jgi:hypothetical protein
VSTAIDMTGQCYGKLTVLRRAATPVGLTKNTHWLCRCACGTEKAIARSSLVKHLSTSCGCHRREWSRQKFTTHGMDATPTYRTWTHMNDRCRNPKAHNYRFYGGRGIQVCDEWRASFAQFLKDMGPRPSLKHSIDRRDNDGPYCAANCVWSTHTDQMNNRSTNVTLTLNGVSHSYAEWSAITGIPAEVLCLRISRHWSVEKALTQPRRHWPKPKRSGRPAFHRD